MKKIWNKYRTYLGLILSVVLILTVLQLLGITCIIKHTTGISCPGCGMTRACISALRLDFAAAFAYHPLWIVLPFALGGMLFCKITHRQRAFGVLLLISVLLLLAVYLWRMLAQNGSVVVFEPQNGVIGRIFHSIFG